jgi:hypothetical protein
LGPEGELKLISTRLLLLLLLLLRGPCQAVSNAAKLLQLLIQRNSRVPQHRQLSTQHLCQCAWLHRRHLLLLLLLAGAIAAVLWCCACGRVCCRGDGLHQCCLHTLCTAHAALQ